jgi:hypothetical protein
MQYRIIKKRDGKFYPRYKTFWGWESYKEWVKPHIQGGFLCSLYRDTYQEAKEYLDQHKEEAYYE